MLLFLAGCVNDQKDWKFIQDIGGMSVGNPYKNSDGIVLPINCDVSGLRTITRKPTILNSDLSI